MSRGYTVAEVMISLALLGVGAGGVIATQKVTQIGNNNARNIATANAIAQTWAERLRAEALSWNAPNGVDDLTTETNWLKHADPTAPAWFNPDEVPLNGTAPAGSPVADILGRDRFTGDTTPAAFCTKIRLQRLLIFPDNTIQNPTTTKIIRAEIRVYWDRAGAPVNCSPIPEPGAPGTTHLGFVTLTTAISQNSLP